MPITLFFCIARKRKVAGFEASRCLLPFFSESLHWNFKNTRCKHPNKRLLIQRNTKEYKKIVRAYLINGQMELINHLKTYPNAICTPL